MASRKAEPNSSHLALVADESEIYALGAAPETRAMRVQRMQANARALAREQIEDMQARMAELATIAQEVADGGDPYPVGVRELSGRLAAAMRQQGEAVASLMKR